MPVIPGVSRARVIVRIWLGIRVVRPLVVPVWIIIVARRIGITVSRKSKTESPNPWKSRGDLSVSTLPGNEGQPAYRQSNQEKLLHRFTSSICFGFCLLLCAGRLRVFLYRGIRMRSAPRLPRRIKWGCLLVKQIQQLAMCLALRARVHASLGQRPRCPAWQTLALKARFIGDRLRRAFSAGGATTEILGRCPGWLMR